MGHRAPPFTDNPRWGKAPGMQGPHPPAPRGQRPEHPPVPRAAIPAPSGDVPRRQLRGTGIHPPRVPRENQHQAGGPRGSPGCWRWAAGRAGLVAGGPSPAVSALILLINAAKDNPGIPIYNFAGESYQQRGADCVVPSAWSSQSSPKRAKTPKMASPKGPLAVIFFFFFKLARLDTT